MSFSQTVRAILCDGNYLLGHGQLLDTMFCLGTLSMCYIGVIVQYQEYTKKFYFHEWRLGLLNDTIQYPLRRHMLSKFHLRMNLINFTMVESFLIVFVLVASLVISIAQLIAYLDPSSGFWLFGVVTWSFLWTVWLVHFYSIFSTGIELSIFSLNY